MAVFSAIAAILSAAAGSFIGGGIGAFILKTVVGIGLSALSQAIAGKPKTPGWSVQGKVQSGENTPRSFMLGALGCTAGSIVYANTHGHANKSENAYLTQVIALSDLPVGGLEELWVNGEKAEIDWEAEGDLHGHPITSYNRGDSELAWIKFFDGTQTAAYDWLVEIFGEDEKRPYSDKRVGRGVAYAVITTRVHKSAWSGIPTFKFILKGLKLYDPSKDTTVGGSGSQRWNNPATWGGDGDALPAVQIYNLLRGVTYDGKWVYGLQNLPAPRLPTANWIAAITKCRQAMPKPGGGTEPQYRSGGEVAVNVAIADGVEDLLTACNGRLAEVGGVYKLHVGAPGSSVFSFTDDDIISTEQQSFSPFFPLSDTVNGVTGRFPNPEEGFAYKDAKPIYREDYEAEDGDRRLLADVSFDMVPYGRQVQRLMKSALKEARRARRHTFALPPEAFELEPNDVIAWTSARNGYVTKLFRVDGMADKANLDQIVDLTEVDPTDYDFGVGEYTPIVSGPTGPVARPPQLPEDFAVSPIVVHGDDGRKRPGIRLIWNSQQDDVDAVAYQVRRAAEPTKFSSGRCEDPETGSEIVSENLIAATAYEVRGLFVPFTARDTAWSAWLPVTTPDIRFSAQDLYDDAVGWNQLAPEIRDFQNDVQDALDEALDWRADELLRLSGLDSITADLGVDLSALDDYARSQIDALDTYARGEIQQINDAAEALGDTVDHEIGRLDDLRTVSDAIRASFGTIPSDRAVAAARLGADLGQDLDALAEAVIQSFLKLGQIDRTLRDAGVVADPRTGVARLYAIDALKTDTSARLAEVQVLLDAQAASISLRATLAQVDGRIASALSAVEPAIRWEFNSDAESWTGYNASLASSASALLVTRTGVGATVTSPVVAVPATANPTLQIRLRRTAGTSWGLTYAVNSGGGFGAPVPIAQPGDDVDAGYVTIRVSPSPAQGWTGTLTRLRLGFGAANDDAFAIDYVSIGPSGFIGDVLGQIDATVNQVQVELDALAGTISQYALAADLGVAVDRIGVAEQTLDAQGAAIGQRATLLQLDGEKARISTAEQRLDAAEGLISQTVTAVQGEIGDDRTAEALIQDILDGRLGDAGRFMRVAFAQEQLGAKINSDIEALATYKRDISVSFDGVTARIATEERVRATADAAEAISRQLVSAQVNDPATGLPATKAKIDTFQAAQSTQNAAFATSITSLTASLAAKAEASALSSLSAFVTEVDTTKSRTFRQSTAPTGTTARPLRAGDLWIRPGSGSEGEELYIWTGGSWFRTKDRDLVAASSAILVLTADLASANAAIVAEQVARASGDSAEATARQTLSAQVNNATTGLPATRATLLSFQTAQANANTSFTQQIGALSAEIEELGTAEAFQQLTALVQRIDAEVPSFRQATAPTSTSQRPLRVGDIWRKPIANGGDEIYLWTGSTWLRVKDGEVVSLASDVTTLSAQVNNPTTGLPATLASLNTFKATQAQTNSAVAESLQSLGTSIDTLGSSTAFQSLKTTVTRIDAEQPAFRQAIAPVGTTARPLRIGDAWYKPLANGGYEIYLWTGTAWARAKDGEIISTASSLESLSSQVNNATTGLPATLASLNAYKTTVAGQFGALADDITTLGTKLDNGTSTAFQQLSSRVIRIDAEQPSFVQTAAPVSTTARPLRIGDVWRKPLPSNWGHETYFWTGSIWSLITDSGVVSVSSRIDSLSSTITDPATGLPKTRADLTSFQGTQATQNSAFSGQINNLNASLAGKANVSVTNGLTSRIDTVETTANGKNRVFRAGVQPTDANPGDLWFDGANGDKVYRLQNNGVWAAVDDKRIGPLSTQVSAVVQDVTNLQADVAGKASVGALSTLVGRVDTVETTANGKNKVFRQGATPVAGAVGDLWFKTNENNRPYRATAPGSANWVMIEDGRIPDLRIDVDAQASRLDSLETVVPTKASASALSGLSTRVTTTEGATSSLAARIDQIEVALPGKASASAVSAIDARVTTAQTTADGKSVIFTGPVPPNPVMISVGDFWINTSDNRRIYRATSPTNWVVSDDQRIGPTVQKTEANAEAIVQINSRLNDPSTGLAASASGVSLLNTRVTNVQNTAEAAQNTASRKTSTFRAGAAPTAADGASANDLWFDTSDGNKLYRMANNGQWLPVDDARISATASLVQGVQADLGGYTASGTFRATVTAAPSGYSARVSLQARTGAEGDWRTAGMYFDVPASGPSRAVVTADRFVVTNGSATQSPFVFQGGQLFVSSAVIPSITTDKITFGDGSVQTSAIANEAVSKFFSAQDPDSRTVTSADGIRDVHVISVTKTAGGYFITPTLMIEGDDALTVRLYLGTGASETLIRGWPGVRGSFCCPLYHSPSGAAHTYRLTVQRSGGGSATIIDSSLIIENRKK